MTETELIEAFKAIHFNAKIHENGWTIDHESVRNTWYDDDRNIVKTSKKKGTVSSPH